MQFSSETNRWRGTWLIPALLLAACGGLDGGLAPADSAASNDPLATGGLQGDYFRDGALTQKALTRNDPGINFFWNTGAPAAGLPSDGFSVRWTGFVTPRFSEEYTFSTYADDGTRLWVNGQEIINDWNHHPVRWTGGKITLKANQAYAIKLEYFEATGVAQVQLNWQSASEPYSVIPANRLSPTVAPPPPPPPSTGSFQVGIQSKADGVSGFDAYQRWLGPKKVEVVASYNGNSSWDTVENPGWILADYGWKPWVAKDPAHRMVQLGVEPWAGAGSLAECATGAYDSHYRNMGTNFVKAGMGRSIFRFAWEEDGYWFAWGTQSLGSDGQWHRDPKLITAFKGCFQHFARAIRQTDPSAIITWDAADGAFNDAAYPGDDVVDQVSHDIYDESFYWDKSLGGYVYPFPAGCDATCMSTRRESAWKNDYAPVLIADANFATQHGKPFSLGEWGIAWKLNGHGGGDNPAFIQHIYDVMTGRAAGMLPGFKAGIATYWDNAGDLNSAGQPTIDTRLRSGMFPNSAAKYRALFGN